MLPQRIHFGTALVVAITSQRAEALTRRPSDDHVRLGVVRAVLDIAVEHVTAEVALECCGGRVVMFDGENRREAAVREVEAEAQAASASEQVDGRNHSLCRTSVGGDNRRRLEHWNLPTTPGWLHRQLLQDG